MKDVKEMLKTLDDMVDIEFEGSSLLDELKSCILVSDYTNYLNQETIKDLECQLKGFKDQYINDGIIIQDLQSQIESLKCCGNCGLKILGKCAMHGEELKSGHCTHWQPLPEVEE